MREQQPKKIITNFGNIRKTEGSLQRKTYQRKIIDKMPIFPKTLEYDDIDKAFFKFVDENIDFPIDGKKIPTFTLYSNQRFSEYSQMWKHSDDEGNLYLNFKAVNRAKNPTSGEIHGSLSNIAGERLYSAFTAIVLEDDGSETLETYSIKQPYAVDLEYNINFVTVTNENLNKFNQEIIRLFSAKQCYIRPNGHFIPMVLDNIADETAYSIDDRKFYVQSVTIKAMAYLFTKDCFQIKKFPLKANIGIEHEKRKHKTSVEIEEFEDDVENKKIELKINFQGFKNKTEFTFDTDFVVTSIEMENIRNFRIILNDEILDFEKTFELKENDNVRIKINPINFELESNLKFSGFLKNEKNI